MTINELIVEFMKEKMAVIDRFLQEPSNYIIKGDIRVMSKWLIVDSIKIIAGLSMPKLQYSSGDRMICPFCLLRLSSSNCATCMYGIHHGICTQSHSSYTNLSIKIAQKHLDLRGERRKITIAPVGPSILSIPGMRDVVKKYKNICRNVIRQIESIDALVE